MPRRIVLATGNAGKLRELRALLDQEQLEIVPQAEFGIEPPEETGTTFVENALLKARHASRLSGLPAIADDSGLEVDALHGAPGIRSARFAGPCCSDQDNNARLLAALAGVAAAARTARYRCAMVYVRSAQDATPLICESAWEGRIATVPGGAGGFGYDPLFLVGDGAHTAAEMPAVEKNRVSHRARALAALVDAIRMAGPEPQESPAPTGRS